MTTKNFDPSKAVKEPCSGSIDTTGESSTGRATVNTPTLVSAPSKPLTAGIKKRANEDAQVQVSNQDAKVAAPAVFATQTSVASKLILGHILRTQ